MKIFLLAAAAAVAMPALAQSGTMPQSGTSTPDSATPATPADQTPPATDMAPAPTPAPADTMSAPAATGPVTVVRTGGMMGGAGVAPQPITAPTAVNPDPPVCRKGQFDGCKNGPQSTHSRDVRARSPQ